MGFGLVMGPVAGLDELVNSFCERPERERREESTSGSAPTCSPASG
jgi:hypothetical protein